VFTGSRRLPGGIKVKSFSLGSRLAAAAVLALVAVASVAAQEEPGERGGRGRRANRGPAGPTPRLPENPLLGVNSGKPDFGGKGMWQVPYIINMQKQGKTPEGGVIEVPFTADAKKIFDYRTQTNSKDDPEGYCLPPGVPA